MSNSSTTLHFPPDFPFPIKVISIDASLDSNVNRGTRLLSYSFRVVSNSGPPETRFGTWDSPIEGSIQKWNIKSGDIISLKRARDKPAISILEPCKHGIQLGGLCVVCGKDMTNVDYTGYSDAARASIQITHSANGPTVSLEEAQRIEKETAQHLFKARKLSLIVDLDQTIVHATVDPTVGEWIVEGEAWEARQALAASSNTPELENDDECNPNWEALKDVKKFKLGPDSFSPLGHRNKGKNKAFGDGCMYYIKPRPGWQEFLRDMATKYELHVYTMGTRAYAEQVCAAIDPGGAIFGGRVLSRDESGSLTQKSLQRLFPCDTSMVVIIDDRSDVWEWSPNLIKVIPYDFFIGIGDINSAFLPKLEQLSTSLPHREKSPSTADQVSDTDPTPEELERQELEAKAMLTENSLTLEAQVEERPLAKRQEELEETTDDFSSTTSNQPVSGTETSPSSALLAVQPEKHSHHRKALLKNDDRELDRIGKLLDEVHRRFFTAYDNRSSSELAPTAKRRASVSGHKRHQPPKTPWDVTLIIPALRSEVLQGVHILFSSVIPLDTPPETTEVWRLAHMFGAKVLTELTSEVTHVVAAKPGTVKVDMARRRGGIMIVYLAWFMDSIALWRRQDEAHYFLEEPSHPSTSPTVPLGQPPADANLDEEDDWELEPAGSSTSGPLILTEINWDDINDEVDAAMNESDDEEDGDARSSEASVDLRSGYGTEDEMTDEGTTLTPPNRRKRLRSLTPSEAGMNGNDGVVAKRKKLDRSGNSKLKVAITAEELEEDDDGSTRRGVSSPESSPRNDQQTAEDGDDDEDDPGDEIEDDFLARELEEELG